MEEHDIFINPYIASNGSIDTLKRLKSRSNAALGMMQVDVIEYIINGKDKELKNTLKKISLITYLHDETVHFFARKNSGINSIDDLDSKKVIIGQPGSGTNITARNIIDSFNKSNPDNPVKPDYLEPNISMRYNIASLVKGDADAFFYVSGKPIPFVEKNANYFKSDDGVHLVKIDDKDLVSKYYKPDTITASDYSFLEGGGKVETLKVKALLVAYDFSKKIGDKERDDCYKKRCEDIRIISKILKNGGIDEIRTTGHKQWENVKFTNTLNPNIDEILREHLAENNCQ